MNLTRTIKKSDKIIKLMGIVTAMLVGVLSLNLVQANAEDFTSPQLVPSTQVLDLGDWFGGDDEVPFQRTLPPCDNYQGTIILFARNIFNLIIVALIIAAIGFIVISGIRMITSGGAQEGFEEGGNTFKNALLGLAAAFIILILINLVVSIFFPDLEENVAACERIEQQESEEEEIPGNSNE